MSDSLIMFLAVGVIAMWIPVALQSYWKKVPLWKSVCITAFLLIAGVAGIYLMYFVENFRWGGRSYYGAVFFVPLPSILMAKLLRLSYGKLTDISAPAGCTMLAVMRIKCYMDDCCGGIMLYRDAEDVPVYFPNQLVEMAVGLVLAVLLLALSRKRTNQGAIYGWYLLLYGAIRLILTFFRWDQSAWLWSLPAGAVWSIVSIIIGAIWLFLTYKKNTSGGRLCDES